MQGDRRSASYCRGKRGGARGRYAPVMVPCTVVPFFSSTVTVSLLSFICASGRQATPSAACAVCKRGRNGAG